MVFFICAVFSSTYIPHIGSFISWSGLPGQVGLDSQALSSSRSASTQLRPGIKSERFITTRYSKRMLTIRRDLQTETPKIIMHTASGFIIALHCHRRLRRGRSVTSLMQSRLLPFLVSLLFWRKKPRQNVTEAATAESNPEIEHTINEADASRSREILKALKLEREIIGTALTTIYESEIQGIITRDERDRLLDKYSSDLKALESRIADNQRIVDTFDLESARKELLLSYREKLTEIDKKLADLRSGPTITQTLNPEIKSNHEVVTPIETTQTTPQLDLKTTGSGLRDVKIRTEKKIEAIREEVLKAMERLEQIESEG